MCRASRYGRYGPLSLQRQYPLERREEREHHHSIPTCTIWYSPDETHKPGSDGLLHQAEVVELSPSNNPSIPESTSCEGACSPVAGDKGSPIAARISVVSHCPDARRRYAPCPVHSRSLRAVKKKQQNNKTTMVETE